VVERPRASLTRVVAHTKERLSRAAEQTPERRSSQASEQPSAGVAEHKRKTVRERLSAGEADCSVSAARAADRQRTSSAGASELQGRLRLAPACKQTACSESTEMKKCNHVREVKVSAKEVKGSAREMKGPTKKSEAVSGSSRVPEWPSIGNTESQNC